MAESNADKLKSMPLAWSLLGVFLFAWIATLACFITEHDYTVMAAHGYLGGATGVCGYLAIAGVKEADDSGRIPVMWNLLGLLGSSMVFVVWALVSDEIEDGDSMELFSQFMGFVATLGLTIAKVRAGEATD